MDKNIIQIDEASNVSHDDNKEKHNLLLTSKNIVIACFLIAVLGMGCIGIFIVANKNDQSNKLKNFVVSPSPTITIPKISSTLKHNKFEIHKTRIASSLDLPPLYPGVQWEDITKGSEQDDMNKADLVGEVKSITFSKGNYWLSKSLVETFLIENYYWNDLSKKGWVGIVNNEPLEFNNFKLSGIFADGVCGGVTGALGYKDGFIRLLSIRRSITHCNPAISSNIKNTKLFGQYVIFISDPTPIEQLVQN